MRGPVLTVTFIDAEGCARAVTAEEGGTLMAAARRAGIAAIRAECGGGCACATCHVIVERSWFGVTGPANPDEAEMLDFATGRAPTSRLSCQIRLTAALDGLVVHTPPEG